LRLVRSSERRGEHRARGEQGASGMRPGVQTEVSDLCKPSGKTCWMKRRKNSTGFKVRSCIFGAEGDGIVGHRNEAAVGDGDAMGVAAEVTQNEANILESFSA